MITKDSFTYLYYNITQVTMFMWTLTEKHSSVTKSLAIEQSETASGRPSCRANAAWRTSSREATSLVAISASLNCRNWTQTTITPSYFNWDLLERSVLNNSAGTWLFDSVSPNCLRTHMWSRARSTDAWAAPREQEAVGIGALAMNSHKKGLK